MSQWYMHLPAAGKRQIQFLPLEVGVALFLDISPVIPLLSQFQTKPGHISRTLEASHTSHTLLPHFFYCKLMVTEVTECKKPTKPPVTVGHRNPGYSGGLLKWRQM